MNAPRLKHALPPVYAAAGLRLLLPLLVLPMVAARIGPEAFGHLSFILVWSGLLAMLVEGGFLAAATRLAVHADAPARWRLAQQVFSARCVLCLPAAALAAVVACGAGGPASDALAIAALACVLGWPATWYLQATQQLARWARVELVVYGALLLLCWGFARSVVAFVWLQGLASAVLALLGWRWLRRDLAPQAAAAGLWSAPQLAAGLRLGFAMLPVSVAGAAYSYALPAAASVQMARSELGLYFMADRIVRALLNAGEPVFALVYPRVVLLFAHGARAALRYTLRWALGGVVAGLAVLLLAQLAWPALGPLLAPPAGGLDPGRLHGVIFILAWLLPLLLGWKFIGYWMLGSGRYDRAYRACVVVGGVVGTALAATAGGAAGATGLAWTALAAESAVIAAALAGIGLTERARRAG